MSPEPNWKTGMVKPSHAEAPMLQWILCENEHARLPDAWELSAAANEVGSCFACGAAARMQPIPAEEQREILSGNDVPGHYILRPLAWARGAGVYQARQAKSRRLVALKVSRLGPDAAQDARASGARRPFSGTWTTPALSPSSRQARATAARFSRWNGLLARNSASGCATDRFHRATRSA